MNPPEELPFLHIGLTGGIASGKSTVAALLRRHGAEILDADEFSRKVVEPGTPGLRAIASTFGPEVIQADGTLDRRAVAAIVFADPARRAALEAIVHPAVRQAARERLEALSQLPPAVMPTAAVEVVPLLFEVGLANLFDEVWVIRCAPEQQIQRMRQRDGLSAEEAKARLAAQWPMERKAKLADRVIENSGNLAELEETVASTVRSAGFSAGPFPHDPL